MYTIGEFSIMSGLSKKTLRYYDEINLLKPIEINKNNKYRLYSKNQIETTNQITYYKKLGVSLNVIQEILHENHNLDIKDILRKKLKDIDNQILILKTQKNNINLELNDINKSKTIPIKYSLDNYVLPEGYIFKIQAKDTDIHKIITNFYNETSKISCKLISSHYIYKDITENSEKTFIFAYVDRKLDNSNIYFQNKKHCLFINNISITNKNNAYIQLIDTMKENCFDPRTFIEEYTIKNGILYLNIYGIID